MKKVLSLSSLFVLFATASFALPTVKDAGLQVEEVVSGLTQPTNMAFIGDNDILVLQKADGRVRRVTDGVLQSGQVLDLPVSNDAERGLLGIALHPDFASNHLVFLYYTESTTDGGAPLGNRVYQYTWNSGTGTLTLANATPILDLPANPGPNHDGGVIAFGPDEKLYVVIGDLNRDGRLQNFPFGGAPDDTSVILRVDPDDGSAPADNPFFAQGGNVARYYAYGVRNSFGMAFDPLTNKLWDTENGENMYDEINLVEPGFNSGWQMIMGPDARNANNASGLFMLSGAHYADPKFSWKRTVGPTAIVFLNSTELGAQYENDVFVGDINNGNLYHFEPNGERNGFVLSGSLGDGVADKTSELAKVLLGGGFNGITDLKVGPDGLLYVLSFFDGAIYRISRRPSFGVSSLPDAEVNANYDVDLELGGGAPPYTVDVIGALPDGLVENDAGISGTPTLAKKFSFTLQITDFNGATTTKPFTIRVLKELTVATAALKAGQVGKNYKATLKASGGKAPYTWALKSGSVLPGALSLSAGGAISGIPGSPSSGSVTFQVTDGLLVTAEKTLLLTIN